MPFTFLAWFIITAAEYVVGQLFRPRLKDQGARRYGLSDLTIPTIEEGRPVSMGWGTYKVVAGNTVWTGDLETRLVKRKAQSNGPFGSGPKHTWGPDAQFYLGIDQVLCVGPIDEVLDIQFEDRSVTADSQVQVVEGRNSIVFANSPSGPGDWLTVDIPVGTYPDNAAVGLAGAQAMNAADPGTWKIVYGYHLLPGYSSKFEYSVVFDGVATDLVVDIAGVYMTGRDTAKALAIALNGMERTQSGGARVQFTSDFDIRTGKFLLSFVQLRTGVTGCYIRGITDYDTTALVNLGFQLGVDAFVSGISGAFESDAITSADHFSFGFGGFGGEVDLGNPAFTAMALFGLSVPASTTGWLAAGDGATVMPFMAYGARPSPSFMLQLDLGDTVRLVINSPELFGGIDKDGGVVGTVDIVKGTLTQTPNDYLEAMIGADLPGYRGICHAVFRHTYLGTSPYMKAVSFVLRRCPNQLDLADGHQNIDGDANPAAMIYEILTHPRWGLGISADFVDSTSFQAVGETLFTEGLGLSMLHDGQTSGGDLIAEILRYVDGLVFADPQTGKLRLRLARPDYDVTGIPALDHESIDSCRLSRPTLVQTKNVVQLTYTDRAKNYQEKTATAIDPANIQARGGERAVEAIDFKGLSNPAAAQRVASRVLKVAGYPLATVEIVATRLASGLRPGDPFKITWAPEGLSEHVFRVTGARLGDFDNEAINITAIEDLFGLTGDAFGEGGGSEWIDPATLPQPFAGERLEEAPYSVATTRRVMTLAARGGKVVDGYQVWSDPTGGAVYTETQDVTTLTPRVQLSQPIGPGDGSLIVEGFESSTLTPTDDPGFAAGKNLLLVDDEWIAWRDITDNGDNTFTISRIARGCIDSAPRDHASGTDVWVVSEGYGFTQDSAYGSDVTVAAKFLGYIGADLMAIASAIRLSVALASRALRPYCPCLLSVNRQSYPANIVGDLVLSWTPRDRTDTLTYDDSGATAARETGTHERLLVYGENDALIHTEDGITAGYFTYTLAAEMADTGLARPSTRLRFVVQTLDADDLESRDSLEWIVRRGSDVGADVDEANKVKVTSADTTPNYLGTKLVAGAGVTLTLFDPGGDETLEVKVSGSIGTTTAAFGVINKLPNDFVGDGATSSRGTGSSILPVRNINQVSDRTEVTSFRVPNDWTSLTAIKLSYCNTSTSSNPWVVRVGMRKLAVGDDGTAAPTFGASSTLTPSTTQDLKSEASLPLPAVTPAPGEEWLLVIQRKPGGDAADTNTDPMALIGLAVEYS